MEIQAAAPAIPRTRWIKLSLSKRVAILVVFLCIALVALDAWQLWRTRAFQLRETEIASVNLAKSLSQHAYDTFKEADTVLVGLAERMENGDSNELKFDRLHALLAARVSELPQLHGLFVYGPSGAWIVNSQPGPPARLNNSDRDYFIYHKTHSTRSPHIGSPIRSKSTGEWIVTISRRLNARDGTFAGVILATIRMDYFRQFYESFDIGKHGALLVSTDKGTILLRRPFDIAYFGRDISAGPLFSKYLPQAPVATNIFTSSLDGVTRINSHRRSAAYPLVILAALSRDDALANWRMDVLMHAAVMTLLVAGLGFLGLRLTRQIERRTTAEAALLESRAELLAANEALEQIAMQDGLTGLANRRCFDLALAKEFSHARRTGTPISLITIDVDNFKQYNDIYGHAAGDACLRQVGAAVGGVVNRPCDLSARYGGEELVILLPDTDAAGTWCVAESIRRQVAALIVPHSGAAAGFVTVSAGVHTFEKFEAASTPVQLIVAADQGLYHAKALGRNRVCVKDENSRVDALERASSNS